MSKILRVAIYIRVSHDEQVRHGLSLEAQRKSLTDYAKKHGYKIVDYYIDEGLTARKTLRKRVSFNRMIEDVKKDKIDLILFVKLDRWFRNVADYYKTMEILNAHKCTWKCTEEDYDLETSTGRLNLNIRLSMAQNESDQTSDRINFVFENRRREGYVTTGSPTFGYKIENKKFVVDENKAEILRDIYNYFIQCGSIAETLFWYRKKYGKLAYSSLRRYLGNRIYIGEYKSPKGEIIDNYFPPIIDRKTFDQVQVLLSKNIKVRRGDTKAPPLIFGGLVYCELCGARATRRITIYKDKSYSYHICQRGQNRACDNLKSFGDRTIEKYLMTNLKKEADKYIAENKIKGLNISKSPVKDNTSKIKSKIKKLTDLYLEDEIDKKEYDERKRKLTKELEENIKDLNKVEKPKDLSNLEKLINSDFETLYNSLTTENKRRFWASFIDKIYINKEGLSGIKFL